MRFKYKYQWVSLRLRDQAKEIMSDYKPGILENSAKMVLLFHLIEESVRKGDKLLVFRWEISSFSQIRHTPASVSFFPFVFRLQSEFVHTDGDRGFPHQEARPSFAQKRQTEPELGPESPLLP